MDPEKLTPLTTTRVISNLLELWKTALASIDASFSEKPKEMGMLYAKHLQDNVKSSSLVVIELFLKSAPISYINEPIIDPQDIIEYQGGTVLHVAVKMNNEPLVRLLCSNKALNINAKNSKGETAYDIAVRLGLSNIADYILQFKTKAPSIHEQQQIQVLERIATSYIHKVDDKLALFISPKIKGDAISFTFEGFNDIYSLGIPFSKGLQYRPAFLLHENATRTNILNTLDELLVRSNQIQNNHIFIYFSGVFNGKEFICYDSNISFNELIKSINLKVSKKYVHIVVQSKLSEADLNIDISIITIDNNNQYTIVFSVENSTSPINLKNSSEGIHYFSALFIDLIMAPLENHKHFRCMCPSIVFCNHAELLDIEAEKIRYAIAEKKDEIFDQALASILEITSSIIYNESTNKPIFIRSEAPLALQHNKSSSIVSYFDHKKEIMHLSGVSDRRLGDRPIAYFVADNQIGVDTIISLGKQFTHSLNFRCHFEVGKDQLLEHNIIKNLNEILILYKYSYHHFILLWISAPLPPNVYTEIFKLINSIVDNKYIQLIVDVETPNTDLILNSQYLKQSNNHYSIVTSTIGSNDNKKITLFSDAFLNTFHNIYKVLHNQKRYSIGNSTLTCTCKKSCEHIELLSKSISTLRNALFTNSSVELSNFFENIIDYTNHYINVFKSEPSPKNFIHRHKVHVKAAKPKKALLFTPGKPVPNANKLQSLSLNQTPSKGIKRKNLESELMPLSTQPPPILPSQAPLETAHGFFNSVGYNDGMLSFPSEDNMIDLPPLPFEEDQLLSMGISK